MSTLTVADTERLLTPYLVRPLPAEAYQGVLRYLDVFEHWRRRVSLTTVTDPAQVVQRHFGEGFALAQALPQVESLLDLGSGAGFPGLPIALARPEMAVTLAESQKKKAAFLKEAAWAVGLPVIVWADRAENFSAEMQFQAVVLRAVDRMADALQTARGLLAPGGTLAFFQGEREKIRLPDAEWETVDSLAVPLSPGQMVIARLAR